MNAQKRILGLLETWFTDRGYEVADQLSYSNTGKLLVYGPGAPTALGYIVFAFHSDEYILRLTWQGREIPSQPGRAGYFDFYQPYDKPSRIWEVLPETVPALKPVQS